MKVVYVPGLRDALAGLIGETAAVLVDGKVAESAIPDSVARISDVEAVRFLSRPALLWDLGAAEPPYPNPDGWAVSASGAASAGAARGGIAARAEASSPGAILLRGSSAHLPVEGDFPDAAGRPHASLAEEAVASLGLSATDAARYEGHMRTALYASCGQTSLAVSGLDPSKSYVLHYMACSSQASGAAFQLLAGGYGGRPRVVYKSAASADRWTESPAEARLSADGYSMPLAVRVTSLRPNAEGEVLFSAGATAGNVLCVSEYEAAARMADVERVESETDGRVKALEDRVAALEAAS